MLYPSPGFIILEIVDPPTKSKLAKPNSDEESNYGKVLDWGLPLMQEGTVLNVPRFTMDTNEEGQGGKERRLKRGDIVVFNDRMIHKMSDDYSSGPKIVQCRFDAILALSEEKQ